MRHLLALAILSLASIALSAQWHVEDSIDPMTDVRKSFVSKTSENKIDGSIFKEHVSIAARCYSDSTNSVDVVIDWNFFLNAGDSRPVQVRVDNNKAKSYPTSPDTTGTAQFIIPTSKILYDLMQGKKLMLRTQNYQGTLTDIAEFELSGFSEAWTKACHWHPKFHPVNGYQKEQTINTEKQEIDSARQKRELRRYATALQMAVYKAWIKPASVPSNIECTVLVTQRQDGVVEDIKIERCSAGGAAARTSVAKAVLNASPLPTPRDDALFDRQIRFTFRPL